MDWFIAALLAGLFFSCARIMSRFILRKTGNPYTYTALHDFIAGLVLLPMILFDFGLPTKAITWLWFFLTVIFALTCDFLTSRSLKSVDISLFNILSQVRHVVILFGGLLLFSEKVTVFKLIAIVFIIIGATISLYKKEEISWSKGITDAILRTIFAAFAFLAAKKTVGDFSQTTFASLELMCIGLFILAYLKFDKKMILEEIKINSWKLLTAGVLFGFFELFLFMALRLGEASKVIPVTQVSLVLSVVGGIILLNERDSITRKLLGTGVIVAGIVLLYMF